MHTSTIVRYLESNTPPSTTEVILMLSADTEIKSLLTWLYTNKGSNSDSLKYVFQWACIHKEDEAKEWIENTLVGPDFINNLNGRYDRTLPFIKDMINEHVDGVFNKQYLPVLTRLKEKYTPEQLTLWDVYSLFSGYNDQVEELFKDYVGVTDAAPDNMQMTDELFRKAIHSYDVKKLMIANSSDRRTDVLHSRLEQAIHDEILKTLRVNSRVFRRLDRPYIQLWARTNKEGVTLFNVTVSPSWKMYTKKLVKQLWTEDDNKRYMKAIGDYLQGIIIDEKIPYSEMKMSLDTESSWRSKLQSCDELLQWKVKTMDVLIIENKEQVVAKLTEFLDKAVK